MLAHTVAIVILLQVFLGRTLHTGKPVLVLRCHCCFPHFNEMARTDDRYTLSYSCGVIVDSKNYLNTESRCE